MSRIPLLVLTLSFLVPHLTHPSVPYPLNCTPVPVPPFLHPSSLPPFPLPQLPPGTGKLGFFLFISGCSKHTLSLLFSLVLLIHVPLLEFCFLGHTRWCWGPSPKLKHANQGPHPAGHLPAPSPVPLFIVSCSAMLTVPKSTCQHRFWPVTCQCQC